MRSRTQRFDRVVVGPHDIASRAALLYGGIPVAGADDLRILSGTISFDQGAAVMARASLTLAEPSRVPTLTNPGQLAPYGFEVAISAGIAYANGTKELLPLGVFPIQRSHFDGATLLATLELEDRSRRVSDARLEDDYEVAAGTNYATAIQDLITAGVPGLTYAFASTVFVSPAVLVVLAQEDRWAAAQSMAKACGCQLYFDGAGRCVLREEPGVGSPLMWTFADGAGGMLISADLDMDRAPAFNRTVVFGSNPSVPFVPRGVATDSDPVTGYASAFGRKPRFYVSPFLTTDAQADQAALAIQTATSGVARGVSMRGTPNFALEPGDVIQITRTAIGVNELHILEAFTVGLTAADEMGLTA